MRTSLSLAALLAAGFLAVACESDGPMEEAGENLDNAGEEMVDAVNDAANDVEDAVEQ